MSGNGSLSFNSDKKAFNNKYQKNTLVTLETGKIPPQAIDVEEAVLGALMLEKNALSAVIDILHVDVFYKEAHQKIFNAIHILFSQSEPIDILTVTNQLKKENTLEEVGGAYYITQLTSRVNSAANIEFHSRILIQKYIQRELIKVSGNLIRDAYEDGYDVFDLMDKAETELFKIGDNNFKRSFSGMSQLLAESIKGIEEAKELGAKRGVPTGFRELDDMTSGFQKSDLIVIAARPGMGKTAFVLSMTRNSAIDFDKPVAVFSLEMSSVQLATRLISSESELSSQKLKKGDLVDYEWEQLISKITPLEDAPIYIDDTPSLSVFELRAKCRRLKEKHDIQMIVIDYIQLMTVGLDSKQGNREQEISTISRSLKSLAKELDVPVVVLSQLNRSVETRGGNKKPQLSDLRESGAIEQDADMVLFIYRPEYYGLLEDENHISNKGWAELIVAKNRNGELKTVLLKFIGQYTKFMDPTPRELEMKRDGKIIDGVTPNLDFDEGGTVVLSSKMNDVEENFLTQSEQDNFLTQSEQEIPF